MGKNWSIKISQASPAVNQSVPATSLQVKVDPAPLNDNSDAVKRLLQDPNAVIPIGEGDTPIFRPLSGKEFSSLLKQNLTQQAVFDAIEASLNRQGFDRTANYSDEQLRVFQSRMESDLNQEYGEVLNLLNEDLFNKKYAQISSLSEEIKFYEDQNLFKLADELTLKLKKVAKSFNVDDLGYKGLGDFFENLITRYACDIPECQEFFCGGGGSFTMTKDYMDFMSDAMKRNPQANIADIAKQLQSQSSAVLNNINLPPDKVDKLNKCYQKIQQQSTADRPTDVAVGNQNYSIS